MLSESAQIETLEKSITLKGLVQPQYQKIVFDMLLNLSKEITYNQKTRVLFVVPESAGDIFLSTALLRSIKEMYDPCDVYFSCKKQYFEILNENPYLHKVIDYSPIMDSQLMMEGLGDWPGLFDISIFVTAFTQKFNNWVNNGKGKVAFNLRRQDALN
jgi:hypothetical protein